MEHHEKKRNGSFVDLDHPDQELVSPRPQPEEDDGTPNEAIRVVVRFRPVIEREANLDEYASEDDSEKDFFLRYCNIIMPFVLYIGESFVPMYTLSLSLHMLMFITYTHTYTFVTYTYCLCIGLRSQVGRRARSSGDQSNRIWNKRAEYCQV